MLYNTKTIGPLLIEIDTLVTKLEYPSDDSLLLKLYNETQSASMRSHFLNSTTLAYKIRAEYLDFYQTSMKPLKDKVFSMDVAVELTFEFALASPTLEVLINKYETPPLLSKVVNEIYHTLVIAQEEPKFFLGDLMSRINQTEVVKQILSDFENML